MVHFAGANSTNFDGASPTGNFVPEIFSQKVLNFFRRRSVVEAITNTDYFGEISSYGDTVRIIKEPVISVTDYLRGDSLTSEALADDEITLVLDQAKYFQFQLDDIEQKISHINWIPLATSSAAYTLKNDYDQSILDYMHTQTLAGNVLNDTEEANLIDLTTPDALLNTLMQLGRVLSENDVPEENRWVVLPPRGVEVLMKADSKLINADYNGGMATTANGLVQAGKLRGFSLYVTNNSPLFDTLTTVETHDVLMAGHMSAVATANAIVKTEKYRSQTTFADVVRGLHVYGRGVVRPESLAIAHVTYTGTDLTP
jgi:hypothetical protein